MKTIFFIKETFTQTQSVPVEIPEIGISRRKLSSSHLLGFVVFCGSSILHETHQGTVQLVWEKSDVVKCVKI